MIEFYYKLILSQKRPRRDKKELFIKKLRYRLENLKNLKSQFLLLKWIVSD